MPQKEPPQDRLSMSLTAATMTKTGSASTAARLAARNMIAIASGKGGVGKTWFAISLSHAFARHKLRTLLFDGDLGLANVDIQLGLAPTRDLGAVMEGKATMRTATTHYEQGSFDILAGRSGSGSLATLSAPRLNGLIDDLVSHGEAYHRVIVDLGAGIDRTVRTLAERAATVLVVTTEEPTALTDAYAFIKVMHSVRPETDLRVVVNMAHSLREGERTYGTLLKACQNFLKMSPPLAGIIRTDRQVRDAIRHQTPLLTRSPNSDAANDVETIAAGLVGPLGRR